MDGVTWGGPSPFPPSDASATAIRITEKLRSWKFMYNNYQPVDNMHATHYN